MIPHRARYALGTLLVSLAVWLMQPTPKPTGGPSIHDLVIADLMAQGLHDLAAGIADRKALGLAKYGTILQAGNGREAGLDAYQEAADLVCYARQDVEEAKGPGVRRRRVTIYRNAVRLMAEIRSPR